MTNQSNEELRRRLGNIEQIRDLLFGSKLAEYEQRFQDYAQQMKQMDANLTEFRTETHDRLNLLRSNLMSEMQIGFDKLNGQVDRLQLSSTEHDLKSQSIEQEIAQNIESVRQSLSDQTQYLKQDLMQTRRKMQEDLVKLSEKLTQALYAELANVQDTKLSQVDLADILFELCLKLKTSSAENSTKEPAASSVESLEASLNALEH